MKPKGYIFYRGPSMLDGAPIVAIAILDSANQKTGKMVQTFFLRSDIEPHLAIKNGADSSVCGDCVHRGDAQGNKVVGRTCYVRTEQGPLSIYRAFRRGNYPETRSLEIFRDKKVRLGSYGDPTALEYDLVSEIATLSSGFTSYSHQWRRCDQRFKNIAMASVDTLEEKLLAESMNWRTFRILSGQDAPMKGEFYCPASPEGFDRLTCEQCLACSGLRLGKLTPKAGSVAIKVHGRSWTNVVLTKTLSSRRDI